MTRALVALALIAACDPKPVRMPSYFDQPPPPKPEHGYGPGERPSCADVSACYSRCKPFTPECVQACEQPAFPDDATRAHTAMKCTNTSGCLDQSCVELRCRSELDACQYAQPPATPTR